jgi:hypothetical protein
MKLKNASLYVVVAILLSSVFAWTSAAKPKPRKPSWEYKIVYTASEEELNSLGTQGWELTTCYVGRSNGSVSTPYCILKRTK